MLYRKNLPTWERIARLTGAAALAFCGYQYFGTPAGTVFIVLSATAALTSVLGFCPMCAMAGRRLESKSKNSA